MAKPKLHTRQQVNDALALLASLPSKVGPLTRKETAVVLLDAVRKALQLGYTLQELRDILRERVDVHISLNQMQTLLDASLEQDAETASSPGITAMKEDSRLAQPSPATSAERPKRTPSASTAGMESGTTKSSSTTAVLNGNVQKNSLSDEEGAKKTTECSPEKDHADSQEGRHDFPTLAAASR